MKQRFYLFRRRGTYCIQDSRTGKQQSLGTSDRHEAARLFEIKCQTETDAGFNQFIIKSCLSTRDPMLGRRTWGTVMDQMKTHGRESTQIRCARAMNCAAFKGVRNIKLVETRSEDFLNILSNHPTLSVFTSTRSPLVKTGKNPASLAPWKSPRASDSSLRSRRPS